SDLSVRLPEGARPGLLRVRAHVRGRGAADRGRHDRLGTPGSRRCRDRAVAGSRGRGDSLRRAGCRPDVPGGSAGRAPRSVHRFRHRVQGRARPAHGHPDPAHRIGGPVMTTAAREKVIGAPVDRVDGPLKVTGAAPYPSDFTFPGLTHAVLVQSTIATGTIEGIDA